jgi:hypothetical protein
MERQLRGPVASLAREGTSGAGRYAVGFSSRRPAAHCSGSGALLGDSDVRQLLRI